MNIETIIDGYDCKHEGERYLSLEDRKLCTTLYQDSLSAFGKLIEERRQVRRDGTREVFEAIDIGEREVAGELRQVVVQPRRVADFSIELEVVIPDEAVDVSTTTDMFHSENSLSLGRVELILDRSHRVTQADFVAVTEFKQFVHEVIDFTAVSRPLRDS
jgi:hypothetical protein